MDHVEYIYTTGMPTEKLNERLHEASFGVLSLARESEAYAVPVSVHYDEGRILLRLAAEDDSEKMRFLDATERATVVLYEAPEADESWSVLLRGTIRPLSDEERTAISDADLNEWFAPYRVFDESVEDVTWELYELDPDSVTGRQTMGPE